MNFTNKCKGMTLVELVIGIAVIAVLFPVMISALFNPVVDSVKGEQMVQAMALAQGKIEEIYATKATNNGSLGYSYITSSHYPAENPVSGFASFNRSVTITEVRGTDLTTPLNNSGFKKIVVTVTWNGGSNRVELTEVLGNY